MHSFIKVEQYTAPIKSTGKSKHGLITPILYNIKLITQNHSNITTTSHYRSCDHAIMFHIHTTSICLTFFLSLLLTLGTVRVRTPCSSLQPMPSASASSGRRNRRRKVPHCLSVRCHLSFWSSFSFTLWPLICRILLSSTSTFRSSFFTPDMVMAPQLAQLAQKRPRESEPARHQRTHPYHARYNRCLLFLSLHFYVLDKVYYELKGFLKTQTQFLSELEFIQINILLKFNQSPTNINKSVKFANWFSSCKILCKSC